MELFEREDAFAALTQLRDRAFARHGTVAVVSGPVAVGKSALLNEFAARVPRPGRVLAAVASIAERGVALSLLSQLALSRQLSAEERGWMGDLVDAGAPIMARTPAQPLSQAQARVAEQICGQLIDLSERSPLVIVIDDAHYADHASLACLAYLCRRVSKGRVAAVFAFADHARPPGQLPGTGEPLTDLRLEALRQPNALAIDLAPLSPAGSAAVVAAAFPGTLAREAPAPAPASSGDDFVASCSAVTGGNPLLLHALIEDQRTEHDPAEPVLQHTAVPGPSFSRAVASCLHRGGPETLAVTQAAAVFDDPAALARLDAGVLFGQESATVSPAAVLASLEAAGLLVAGRFRHPAIRNAVLGDLPQARHGELHACAAALAYEEGESAGRIAAHLLAAGPACVASGAPMPWAVPVLKEAAMHELDEGQVRKAIDYLKLACVACADTGLLAGLKVTLLQAELELNSGAPARYSAGLTEAVRDEHLHGKDMVTLTRALLGSGRIAEAADMLTRLSGSPSLGDPETAAELRAFAPWLRSSFPALFRFAPSPQTPRDQSPGNPDSADAVLGAVLTNGPLEQAVRQAERILRDQHAPGRGMRTGAVESALLGLVYADRPDLAAPHCDEWLQLVRGPGSSPARAARLYAIRSEIAVRQGDLADAVEYGTRWLDVVPAARSGVALAGVLGALLTALSAMGRLSEAARALDHPVPEAALQSRFGLHYLHGRGSYYLAIGDPAAAAADFGQCGELMRQWCLDRPGLIAWRNAAAEAALHQQDTVQARRLAEDQLSRCDPETSPRTHGNALRLLAAATENPRARVPILCRAVNTLLSTADRLAQAQALTDLAAAYARVGDTRRAKVVGRQAWSLAQRSDAAPLIERLGPDVAPAVAPRDLGPDAPLTDAETRIAQLVVAGHTNREIAGQLFLTVSTVEQHLTRIYRKLGISGRVDLALRMITATAGAAHRFRSVGQSRDQGCFSPVQT